MHQNYIDSDELKLSGAVYSPSFQCEYVKGIASRKIPVEPLELNNKKKRYIRGMVRKKIADRRNWLSRILIFIRHTSYQLLTTPSGIILNLFIGVVHLLFLLLVPNVINIILLLSLLQITKIQDEIFFPVFTIGDCFNASSYSFWLHYLKGKYLVWIFCIVGIAYVAIGLLSLTSYYVTDGLNTGRYHTVVHPYKKLSDLIFWYFTIFYIILYGFYISVVLVWCILGAVLNPNKFLPLATGAIVIIALLDQPLLQSKQCLLSNKKNSKLWRWSRSVFYFGWRNQ